MTFCWESGTLSFDFCWRLQVGLLSGKTRLVRVKNVLTEQEDVLEVPTEETVGQVTEAVLQVIQPLDAAT